MPIYHSHSLSNLDQINLANDLNLLEPASCEGYGLLKESRITKSVQGKIRPVFRNIETEIIDQINKHDIIVGCVAWLTSVPILKALQGKHVQFVVQQEDWLRPDSDEWQLEQQRYLYKSLSGISNFYASASYCGAFNIQPIRLSGKPKTNNRSNPRMHHKFILFGSTARPNRRFLHPDFETCTHTASCTFDLLWTGSYNMTSNATKSLENGLFIESMPVIDAYYMEWRQILLSSFRIEDKWWDQKYGWDDDSCLRDGT